MYTARFSIEKTDYFFKEEVINQKSTLPFGRYLKNDAILLPHWYGNGLSSVGLNKYAAVDENELITLLKAHLPEKEFKPLKARLTVLSKKLNKQSKQGKSSKRQKKITKKDVGLEFVLSAVKSFSILLALETPENRAKLIKAHLCAVESALDEMESKAAYARRGHGGKIHEKVKGLSFAIFTHLTSRAMDPQVHSHVLIPSKHVPRLDGTFGAIEERHIHVWKSELNAVYLTKLAENVRELGYDTIATEKAFEIRGIPSWLIDWFSKRQKELLEEAKKGGRVDYHAKAIAARNTRAKKKACDIDELFNRWVEEAASLGFSQCNIEKLRQRSFGMHINDEELCEFPELTVNYLAKNLVQKTSTFSEPQAFKFAVELARKSGQSVNVALNAVDKLLCSNLVVELESHSRYKREFTTKAILKKEYEMIRGAQTLSESNSKDEFGLKELSVAEARCGITLSDEQREAVLTAIDNSKLSVIAGSSGSGKTTLQNIIRHIYTSNGRKVYGAAISKLAAQNLQSEASIPSQTIAKLLLSLESGTSSVEFGDVLIIDEAGLVGLDDASNLIKHANRIGFKLILAGDHRQLRAIEHSGTFHLLKKLESISSASVSKIIRQTKAWDRKAVMQLRDGNAGQALAQYRLHNRLTIADTQQQACSSLIKDWEQYTSQNPHAIPLIIARTWQDVTTLNEEIRTVLIRRGMVGTENIPITGRVGSRILRFSLSKGDKIRLTKNDYQLGLANGDTATVKEILSSDGALPKLIIEKQNGSEFELDLNSYSDRQNSAFIAHSYAQTIYASQGQTVKDKVFVLSDDRVDRASAYVALSRHKSDSHLYVSKSSLSPEKQIDDNQAIEILSHQYSNEQCATLAIERTSLNGESLADAGGYAYKNLEKEPMSQEMSLA